MCFVSFLTFFFQYSGRHRDLHSFPTRRSSDLWSQHRRAFATLEEAVRLYPDDPMAWYQLAELRFHGGFKRSEEHTSELQSHVNLVCRLLLEKKNLPLRVHLG